MTFYRVAALVLAASFLLVGALFLAVPDGIIGFFNRLSGPLGLSEAPPVGHSFFLVLASGYMYLVSLLAWLMYRHPKNSAFPLILAHGKSASSLLSLLFFLTQGRFLIYLANFLVDGLVAGGVYWLSRARRPENR